MEGEAEIAGRREARRKRGSEAGRKQTEFGLNRLLEIKF